MHSIALSSFSHPRDESPECKEFSSLLHTEKSGKAFCGDGDSNSKSGLVRDCFCGDVWEDGAGAKAQTDGVSVEVVD